MNRKTGVLSINAVYAEADAPADKATVKAIRDSINDLATFLGAKTIDYSEQVPKGWRGLQQIS